MALHVRNMVFFFFQGKLNIFFPPPPREGLFFVLFFRGKVATLIIRQSHKLVLHPQSSWQVATLSFVFLVIYD